MQSSLYVALSAQVSLQKRLDTIAFNVANANSGGFRADGVSFQAVLAGRDSDAQVSFVGSGDGYLSRSAGPLTRTDNPFDVAIQGDGWIAIRNNQGIAYTRDGRMRMAESGELQTLSGQPVLDVGGAPLRLDPTAGPPQITGDGMITQAGRQIGAIGLFAIDEQAKLTRDENSSIRPDRPARPILDFTTNGLAQGFMEGSNVNPILEVTRLISTSRAFEGVTNSIEAAEAAMRDAIKTLSGA